MRVFISKRASLISNKNDMHNKRTVIFTTFIIVLVCAGVGLLIVNGNSEKAVTAEQYILDEQAATIQAIKRVRPAVVSIIVYGYDDTITVDMLTGRETITKERVEKGQGSGFLISPDGFIITNKHVIDTGSEKDGEYRIMLNSGKQYYAQFIGRDPVYDLAILKIFDKDLPFVELGDSNALAVGTTVIAIGNALGKYQNSVTKGIVSGLGRSLFASDLHGHSENLDNVIQTDADINLGNSGGPLIDLYGRVIGINVATDLSGVGVGFAIPVNDARPAIRSALEKGRIIRPRLGIRYIMLIPELVRDFELKSEYGAWIKPGEADDPAILPNSPAAEAGLLENDIITEINAIKLQDKNTLLSVVQKYQVGDRIGLKIQRGDKILIREAVLDEFK